MKRLEIGNWRFAIVLCVLCAGLLTSGCGNVYLTGEALTACEQSAMDAYQAHWRAESDPATSPLMLAYLGENFQQWRSFVRSARRDAAWGPKLETETTRTD